MSSQNDELRAVLDLERWTVATDGGPLTCGKA
jgi:hypothetical protein